MVHRDIKPANLILAREGKRAVVKLLDFGLAKLTSEDQVDAGLTREGQMLGTPEYIAPEQIRNAQSADIRADIYSLGCTFYYLLTGEPPFHGEALWDLYQAHFSMDAGPLNLVRPEVPVELAALVAKMLAKEPDRRFQTPAEVAQALVPFFKPGANPGSGPRPEISLVGQAVSFPRPVGGERAPSQPATIGAAPDSAPRRRLKPNPEGVAWESLIEFKETEESLVPAKLKPPPKLKPVPEPATIAASLGRPTWVQALIATGVLLFGLVVASVIVFRTKNGTIAFENLPEQSIVTADGSTFKVDWPDGKGKGHAQITIPPGEYSVKVELNGVEVCGEEVKIAAGDKKWITVRREPRGVDRPPVEAIGRTYTDNMLVIKTDNSDIMSHVRGNFLVLIDRNIKAELINDTVYINEVFGRKNVLCTRALSPSAPATIDFSRITMKGSGRLILWVHGYHGHLNGQKLVVRAGGDIINEANVVLADGWKRIEVPFHRNTIVVEHYPDGWNGEFIFVDYSIVGDSALKYSTGGAGASSGPDQAHRAKPPAPPFVSEAESAAKDPAIKALAALVPPVPSTLHGVLREVRRFDGNTRRVRGLAFSRSGRTVLSGGKDGNLRLWDTNSGRELARLRGHNRDIADVAFLHNDMRAVTGGDDNILILWDVEKREIIRRFVGHTGAVINFAVSPDEKRLVSCGHDTVIRVWDIATGQEIGELIGYNNSVYSVAFSPDGRHLLSGDGHGRRITLWDAETYKSLSHKVNKRVLIDVRVV
jgi:hypothetical protein